MITMITLTAFPQISDNYVVIYNYFVSHLNLRFGCLVRSLSNLSLRASNNKSLRVSKLFLLYLKRDKPFAITLLFRIELFSE